jgi:hypothetical protein
MSKPKGLALPGIAMRKSGSNHDPRFCPKKGRGSTRKRFVHAGNVKSLVETNPV